MKRIVIITLSFLLLVSQAYSQSANAVVTMFGGKMGGTGNDEGIDIATDANSNVYTVGRFTGTGDFDPSGGITNLVSQGGDDAFLVKQNSSGVFQWAVGFGGTGQDLARGVATDAYGDIYVIGDFTGTVDFDPGAGTASRSSVGSTDFFVAKFNASGIFQWVTTAGGTDQDFASEIVIAGDSSIFVTGGGRGSIDFDPGTGTYSLTGDISTSDVWVWKLNADGSFAAAAMTGAAGAQDFGNGIAWRPAGIVVVGEFGQTMDANPGAGVNPITSNGSTDGFILFLDDTLGYQNAYQMGGTSIDRYFDVSIDSDGNSFVSGYFDAGAGTVDADPSSGTFTMPGTAGWDATVTKLDENNAFVWAKRLGGGGNEQPFRAMIHPLNQILYTVGRFNSGLDFDPGAGTILATSLGWNDIFISALDSNGNYVGHNRMGGTAEDNCFSMDILPSGRIVITGSFSATMNFSTMTSMNIAPTGGSDIFVIGFDPYCPPPFVPNFNASAFTVCEGTPVDLTLSFGADLGGAAGWYWYEGSCGGILAGQGDTLTVMPTTTTDYFLRAEGGCLLASSSCGTGTITVVAGHDTTVSSNGLTLTAASGATSYQWYDCGTMQPVFGATSQSFTPTIAGSFFVVVSNGTCESESDCHTAGPVVSIQSGILHGIHAYPNPATTSLQIEVPAIHNAAVAKLHALNGAALMRVELEAGLNTVDIKHLASGTYFLVVSSADGVATKMITKH